MCASSSGRVAKGCVAEKKAVDLLGEAGPEENARQKALQIRNIRTYCVAVRKAKQHAFAKFLHASATKPM